jgi:Tol biopolymer transport system component
MDGSNQIQITKNEGGYPRLVSSDGHWIFYLSGKTGRLWKVSTESGEEIQLSDRKFRLPQISPDGQLIADIIHDNPFKIGIMRIGDQKELRTIDHGNGNSRAFALSWMPDSRTLNFVAEKEESNLLWRQSIDDPTPQLVADLGTDDIEKLSFAPGGKGFAFIRGKWVHDAVLISGLK